MRHHHTAVPASAYQFRHEKVRRKDLLQPVRQTKELLRLSTQAVHEMFEKALAIGGDVVLVLKEQ